MKQAKFNLIKKQLEKGALPHAYLFSGTDHGAKEEAIKLISESFLGKNYFFNIDFQEFSGNPITIEEIRMLKERVYSTPLGEIKNIFLVRNIENLSREAAPALLKILEDPPENLLLLATTEKSDFVLDTVKSRFAHIMFFSIAKKGESKPKSIDNLEDGFDYFAKIVRQKPIRANIKILERLLEIEKSLNDPTVNKRLLGEYFALIMKHEA